MAQIELLRVGKGYIFNSALCMDKILIGLERRQEHKSVLTERFDDLLQILCFEVF